VPAFKYCWINKLLKSLVPFPLFSLRCAATFTLPTIRREAPPRALRRAATERCQTAKAFIEEFAASKPPGRSLSSALRVAVCGHFQALAPRVGYFDPDSRMTLRIDDDRPGRVAYFYPNMLTVRLGRKQRAA
jgi:hypothetical protein